MFTVRPASVGWFGEAVAYLRPEPEAPLRRLPRRLVERWPDHPPYVGDYDDATPHLTIGQEAGVDVLQRAATAVARQLPITQRVATVHLLTGSDEVGSWSTLRAFPLAAHVEVELTPGRP